MAEQTSNCATTGALPSADMESAAGAAVTIHLLAETAADVRLLAEQNHWDEEEAWRIVGANGIAFLRANATLERLTQADGAHGDWMQQVVQRAADFEAMYSVMKYRVFVLTHDIQALDFAEKALHGELQMCKAVLEIERKENERLKRENTELRRRLGLSRDAEIDQPAGPPGEDTPSHAATLRRLWGREER